MSSYNIYPKQFQNARIPIEKNRCFMLMPFNRQYDLIYGQIKNVLTENGFICNRADELFGSVPIMSNVLKEILKAHFIIADLTGQNANVFYELGIAHSFKDAQNIILIAQSLQDVPFDIRHLSTIIYSADNLRHLTATIHKTIEDNSHYYAFFEALQRTGIIGSIHENKDEFLNALQEFLGEALQDTTDLLDGQTRNYSPDRLKRVLDACLGALYSVAAKGDQAQLKGITSVIGTLLSNGKEFPYARDVMRHLLYENKLENYPIDRNEILYLQSELATLLAARNAFFNEALTWIITYFSRSKSATVDLNRYGLEKFLLTSSNPHVDEAVVNAVFHENQYVREHMADIIGEKVISAGQQALIAQLPNEENIYAMSSMVTALGKLGDKNAYPHLRQWFEKRKDRIISTHHFFILKHFHIALVRLGISDEFTANFEKEFAEHINPLATF